MNTIVIYLFFAFFSLIALSSSIIFNDEMEKIASKYTEIHLAHDSQSPSYYGSKLPVESILQMDAKDFFQNMQKTRKNYHFQIAFWFTFDTHLFFFCKPKYCSNSKEFVGKIISSGLNSILVPKMIYHFKEYLNRKLFSYSDINDRRELLKRAIKYFNTNLTNLIRKLQGGNDTQFKKMPRNFLFYQQCVAEKDPKSILLSEFSRLKPNLESDLEPKDKSKNAKNAENFTFLASALNYDKSTHFGLGLISDLPPNFIGCFMFVHLYRDILLIENPWTISKLDMRTFNYYMMDDLHRKFPIFRVPARMIPSAKFCLSKEFINTLNEIKDEAELNEKNEIIVLAKSLFEKIVLL
jgi:hypothetical protein